MALTSRLFRLAGDLERQRLFRFAEQLRAATLSITNNIAEGSGSVSDAEFANYELEEQSRMILAFRRRLKA